MSFELLLGLAAFCAGLLKVGFGQGAGFLALPVATLAVPARFANGLLAPLLSLGDFVSVPAYWRQWRTRLLLLLVPGQVAGSVFGAWLLAKMSELAARRAIGALLVVAVALQLWSRRFAVAPPGSERRPFVPAAVAISVATGVTSSIAQLGSGILSLYFVHLGMDKRAIVPTLNVAFMFSNLAKIAMYWRYGIVTPETLLLDAWLSPLLIVGGLTGVAAHRRLSQRAFENALLAFAAVSGARLLLWR